jgi:hypothetical protein
MQPCDRHPWWIHGADVPYVSPKNATCAQSSVSEKYPTRRRVGSLIRQIDVVVDRSRLGAPHARVT